jgi:predicted HTH transcriptional regulator
MTLIDIVTSIDQRLTQAKAEIAQLDSARQALTNGAAPAATRKPRRAPRKSTRTASAIVPAGKLAALLNRSPGMSTSELAKATNGKRDQILALLRELEDDNHIRRTGQRRGTRWHLITTKTA